MLDFVFNRIAVVFITLCFVGCDSAPPNTNNTPYSVWPSARQISAYKLAEQIMLDDNAANHLCQQDVNKPAGYVRHFALVSTPGFNRIDAAQKFQLDPNMPVTFGVTNKILAPKLGDFLAQKGNVDPRNKGGREMIKLTFSKEGKFTGFCDETKGYTTVVNSTGEEGQLSYFVTNCHTPSVVVCMSVRE